ncbi:MAG TPA: GNAT family N-acetyltransferase [Actinomycetota bacterium]|jgi:predicted GNAT family acetyltransferase|nr:GNAT family N-acetyltransferase [Actinomycetota bacterium]
MRVVRTDDVTAFLDLAGPLLRRDEARNNLVLGLVASIVADPRAHEEHDAWIALDPGPVAAAIRTPPRQLLVADAAEPSAIEPLVHAIAEDAPTLPGATGNRPTIDDFGQAWTRTTGRVARVGSDLTVFALRRVAEVHRAPGSMRAAVREDRDLLVAWLREFTAEAPLPDEIVANELETFLEGRLEARNAGYRLWEADSRPVSLAGFIGPRQDGARIGPVYTPSEHRGAGYARSLLAELARELLDRGYHACYLASDDDNRAATALYTSVGFEPVAHAAMIVFERSSPAS